MSSRGSRGGGRNGGRGSENRSTSQSQSNIESRPSSSVRGSNVLEQVSNNPSKRKFIEVESDKEFTDHASVIRGITCILKSMFGGPWATWRRVDKDSRKALWQRFREENLKRHPNGIKLYAKLHTRKSTQEYVTPKAAKVKEAYESAMLAKYGDDTTCYPLLDNETWCDVTGGVKKRRIYIWICECV